MTRTTCLLLIFFFAPPARAAPGPHRVAILVGANAAPPGRRPLLYGHRDAEEMAAVLRAVGGFGRGDVSLLLDPRPDEVIATLEKVTARLAGSPESLLYFYYSGHADEQALYPSGRPLALDRLRALLDGAAVSVKVGMIDACRGGGWTRAKGLAVDEPFAMSWPVSLASEGSVLIASSSGLESAHESDELRGSFFTFHFVAGLRGAADRDGNGEVTLTEAFEYAKELTVRDTARQARQTQHPSYAVALRGRRDLVLAEVGASPTRLEVREKEGPLEIIHLESGLELVELAAGRRSVTLAVPPGRYLIRKAGLSSNLVKELVLGAGERVAIDESDLTLTGSPGLSAKSAAPPERLPFRFFVAPLLGSGLGWARGTPELNVTDRQGRRLEKSTFGSAGLVHVGLDLAVRLSPHLMIGGEVRAEFVTGASEVRDVSCPGGVCRPPHVAPSLLARATAVLPLSPRLELLGSVAAGAGVVRHRITIAELADCGPSGTDVCADTIASGPVLASFGLGATYQLSGPLAAYAALDALVAFPQTALNIEGQAGLALRF